MTRTNLLFIFLLSFVIHFQGNAQMKKAERLFKYYDYAKAIPYLVKAVGSDDANVRKKATPMLADSYRLTNNTGKAREWYEKAVQIDDTDPINYFYLGQAYRGLGLYEKAAGAFKSFGDIYPDSLNAQKFYNYSVEIQDWLKLPPMAEVKNTESINSRYSDFSPAFYKSGVVFTSDRKKDKLDDTYGWTNFNYLNLHYTEPEYYKNLWSPLKPAEELERNFNQQFHDGPATFTSDFKRVYMTKTVEKDRRKDKGNIRTALLKIFYADIEEGQNLRFIEFPFNSKNYSVGHPALSPDNKKMIFSSDMPGGYGGTDLYITTLENGQWTQPRNLGENINTPDNEVFPYWANDSLLFFASDGHMGYGGLDIFRSELSNASVWEKPENLKAPINSSYDDFGILFSENLSEGLFSSNRPEGMGADDIYAFRGLRYDGVKQPDPMAFRINGRVMDSKISAPLELATVFLLDPIVNEVLIAKTDDEGNFEVNGEPDRIYVVKAMKDDYVHDCLSIRTPNDPGLTAYNLPRDLKLSKLEIDQITNLKIYYDLDKWAIREDALPVLDSLVDFMRQYPIRAELSSHTDSRATAEYNYALSQKRAEAAVQYIVAKGIDPFRIVARGYGESRLVNHCADGVACTETEHQANRRTEFKITGFEPNDVKSKSIDLDVFRQDDIVSPTLFDAGFFSNCHEKSRFKQ